MKKILFICTENSCRSQMAEAFARMYGREKVQAFSAGSKPSGKINEKAIEAMKEIGYDLTQHKSKSINEAGIRGWDFVITMGCGDDCPFIQAKHHIDWNIPDPQNLSIDEVKKIRDTIKNKVSELLHII